MQLGTLEGFPNYLPHIAAMLHFNSFLGRWKVTTGGKKENDLSSLESVAVQQQSGGCAGTSLAVLGKKPDRKADDAARIDGKDGKTLNMTHKGAGYKVSNSDIVMF